MAQANAGPVMVQDAADVADPADNGRTKPNPNPDPAKHDDADDGDAWETDSLYEDALEEEAAFEYSTDGTGPKKKRRLAGQLTASRLQLQCVHR
jgi:hypothetical protein